MKLLALDTATEACSAALWIDGEVQYRYSVAPQQHARLLLPMIDELMADAGLAPSALDGLVFGQGPGSFTGVRISVAAAQGIAFAIDCGLIGVSTLQAIAHRAWREHGITYCVAAIDARMQQVYWGSYITCNLGVSKIAGVERVDDPVAVSGSALISSTDHQASQQTVIHAAGSGSRVYASQFTNNGINTTDDLGGLYPSAVDMVHLAVPRFNLGESVSAENAAPVYLRDKVALTEQERSARKKTD